MNVTTFKPRPAIIVCSACGAQADSSCNCGAPYIPASKRAKVAVEANPEKSDRAISAEIGVGRSTVQRARPGGPCGPPGKRLGRDGKLYSITHELDIPGLKLGKYDNPKNSEAMHPRIRKRGIEYRAREAYYGAKMDSLKGIRISPEIKSLIRKAADAWEELARSIGA